MGGSVGQHPLDRWSFPVCAEQVPDGLSPGPWYNLQFRACCRTDLSRERVLESREMLIIGRNRLKCLAILPVLHIADVDDISKGRRVSGPQVCGKSYPQIPSADRFG